MGLYFEVQCTECGYHKTLYEGECGLEDYEEMRIKKEFESGEGDPYYRKIYEHLRSTVTQEEAIGSSFLLVGTKPGSDEWEENRLLFGEPYIRLMPTIYQCFDCKSFFNHNRMSIICSRSIFRENKVECPICKSSSTSSMSADDFSEDEGEPEVGYNYICKARCPKCYGKVRVLSAGIAG